jgi:membrane-associated PAP2 superfamily phosphatase
MTVNRSPRTRILVAVAIGVLLGIGSYFQFGHRSLSHHDFYLSFMFGIAMTATWVAITTDADRNHPST